MKNLKKLQKTIIEKNTKKLRSPEDSRQNENIWLKERTLRVRQYEF